VTANVPAAATSAVATWENPAWWAPGLALHERGARAATGMPGEIDPANTFALRIADLGLDEDTVRALRAESPAELAARVPRPEWVTTVERAVRDAEPVTDIAEVSGNWRDAFGRVLAPFADGAVQRIAGRAGDLANVDLPDVTAHVGAALRRGLAAIAARTLVTELHRWRGEGRLTGCDSRARFVDFARALAEPAGLVGLFTTYPVLARLLAQAATDTATATLELLNRLATDRAVVVDTLLGGVDPGRVTGIVSGRGDRHLGGCSVVFVDFTDGRRIVYKPRDVTTQVRVQQFLDRLAGAHPDLAPRVVTTLARAGYGWSEFVPARELTHRTGADRFYRRQGALLALLHVLRATDMHYENVIADGDTPVLIDTETLFNAELVPAGTGDPAADMLASSVYRTALLPLIVLGEQGAVDLSWLGGDRGRHSPTSVVDWLDAGTDRMRLTRRAAAMTGSANRPRLRGTDLDPRDHEQAMIAGFRQAHGFITTHRAAFAELVSACADLEIRVITRPGWLYGTLLDETTHPDVLRDALDRDEALSVLYANRATHPLFGRLVAHEIAAMWDGDVPMFLSRAGSGELRVPDGTRLPVSLPRSGVSAALDTLAGMDEVDRKAQEWVISATLATRRRGASAHPLASALPSSTATTVVHPDALVTAARSMADRIVAHTAGEDRVNWLGLEHVDGQWLVLPMGASLGSGYLGVALFLAQLAEVTGTGRYADQARRAVADAPALVDAFAARPALVATAGWGGLTGLGGITYGLARLSRLLDDPVLLACATQLTELAGDAAATTTEPGWVSGLAGCLASMSSVHADLGLERAGIVAGECADRLADMADRACTLSLSFADGLAGVAWALTRFGPARRHREAGRRGAAQLAARGTAAPGGWCHGGPGMALAAACVPAQIDAADVAAMADDWVRRDLCLCHGELGVTEVLATIAGPDDRHSPAANALARRTGQVLDVLRRHGPVCGVPGNVPTPGLLTGLAGIGYGLLRLADPRHVPSVLLLQPSTGRED
jgi:type 2 lantibiotic biosynthesis protein LanM